MSITATELKMNLGKYLLLAESEDIFITKNEKVVAKLSNPNANRASFYTIRQIYLPCSINISILQCGFTGYTFNSRFLIT